MGIRIHHISITILIMKILRIFSRYFKGIIYSTTVQDDGECRKLAKTFQFLKKKKTVRIIPRMILPSLCSLAIDLLTACIPWLGC